MTKRGLRSQAYNEAKLRRRIAVRILEIWHQSGYAENLAARALKALSYLQSANAPELKSKQFRTTILPAILPVGRLPVFVPSIQLGGLELR